MMYSVLDVYTHTHTRVCVCVCVCGVCTCVCVCLSVHTLFQVVRALHPQSPHEDCCK